MYNKSDVSGNSNGKWFCTIYNLSAQQIVKFVVSAALFIAVQCITHKNNIKPKATINFTTTELAYFDWYTIKVILVTVLCESNACCTNHNLLS
jgi:5-enolpyruvylshikimate-3-phosphate synthase